MNRGTSPYAVRFKVSAEKELARLPVTIQARVVEAVRALSLVPKPPGVKKLKGWDDSYRVRVGDYRIVYQLLEKEVVIYVVRIAHRSSVYG